MIFECGNNQPRRWDRIGAPRYVALALAAVMEDIPTRRARKELDDACGRWIEVRWGADVPQATLEREATQRGGDGSV